MSSTENSNNNCPLIGIYIILSLTQCSESFSVNFKTFAMFVLPKMTRMDCHYNTLNRKTNKYFTGHHRLI